MTAPYRLEIWSGEIDLTTCTPDEYDATVACSSPHEIRFATRAAVDAWLDAKERAFSVVPRRTMVEIFLYYRNRNKPVFTYRRDREGRFVPAGSKEAIAPWAREHARS